MSDDPSDNLPDRIALRRRIAAKLNSDEQEYDAKDPSRQANHKTGWYAVGGGAGSPFPSGGRGGLTR